jgi:plasmid stabilization system protein ParE
VPVDVRVSRRALAQVREAARWWKRNRASAPHAIEEELAKAINLMAVQPGVGAQANDVELSSIRRIRLERIGYFVYYAATADGVEILAFWHVRRGSNPPL